MLRKINSLSTPGTIVLGTIIPLYDEKVPEFWLLCNGQSCIGTEFHKKTGYENVPDLTGRFIRCIGGNSESMGLAQEDCIRNITGSFSMPSGSWNNKSVGYYGSGSGVFLETTRFKSGSAISMQGNVSGTQQYNYGYDFDTSAVVPTGPENRPINMAFPMIIYVGKTIETIADTISLKKKFKAFNQIIKNIINNIRNLYYSPLSLI